MSKKERINNLLNDIPDSLLNEVLSYLMFLSQKNDMSIIQEIEDASLSSIDFWNNPDDEVWDYV